MSRLFVLRPRTLRALPFLFWPSPFVLSFVHFHPALFLFLLFDSRWLILIPPLEIQPLQFGVAWIWYGILLFIGNKPCDLCVFSLYEHTGAVWQPDWDQEWMGSAWLHMWVFHCRILSLGVLWLALESYLFQFYQHAIEQSPVIIFCCIEELRNNVVNLDMCHYPPRGYALSGRFPKVTAAHEEHHRMKALKRRTVEDTSFVVLWG